MAVLTNCSITMAVDEFRIAIRSSWAVTAQSVWRLATGWTVRRSNSGAKGRDFPHSSRLGTSGPRSLLYNGYQGVKRPRRGAHHPPPSSVEVTERTELPLCACMACSSVNLNPERPDIYYPRQCKQQRAKNSGLWILKLNSRPTHYRRFERNHFHLQWLRSP